MTDFIEIAFWVIGASAVVFIVPGLFALSRAFVPPVNSNATAIGRDGERLAVIWRDDNGPLDHPSKSTGE